MLVIDHNNNNYDDHRILMLSTGPNNRTNGTHNKNHHNNSNSYSDEITVDDLKFDVRDVEHRTNKQVLDPSQVKF